MAPMQARPETTLSHCAARVCVPVLAFFMTTSACDGDDEVPGPPTSRIDAGSDATVPASHVLQMGSVVTLVANTPVENAKVTVATAVATTDAQGAYQLSVPKGVPVVMTIEAKEHYRFVEQEYVLQEDFDRDRSSMLSDLTAALLTSRLPGYREDLGAVAILVATTPGGCAAGTAGAIVNVVPAGAVAPDGGLDSGSVHDGGNEAGNGPDGGDGGLDGSLANDAASEAGAAIDAGASDAAIVDLGPRWPHIAYFRSNAPDPNAVGADPSQGVTAVAWNLPPGINLALRVHKAGCNETPFPVTIPSVNPSGGKVTYTGRLSAAGGKSISVARAFLQ